MIFVKTVDDAQKFIKEQFEIQKRRADDTVSAWKPLIKLPDDIIKSSDALSRSPEYWWKNSLVYSSYNSDITSFEALQKRRDLLIEQLDQVLERCQPIWQQNEEIIQHNKSMVEKVKFLMRSLGIPDTYSERDLKSRSRDPKYITRRAGYLDDIGRIVPVSDGTKTSLIKRVSEQKKIVLERFTTRQQAILELDRAKVFAEKQAAREKFIATAKVKLELSWEADEYEILSTLVNKDKFLNLAHTMMETRNQFDRGYKPILYALEKLDLGNSVEQAIHKSISVTCENWDGDGRIFRDCEWNYDRVFELVDADLLSLYTDYKEWVKDY